MTDRVLAASVNEHQGETITVAGWVHRIRELGAVSFVLLRDRSGMVQLVFDGKSELAPEHVVSATGTVAANEKAPGGFEVQVEHTETLGASHGELPIAVNQDPESIGIDALFDNRLLSLRIPKVRSIFAIQATIADAFA
ncbi:MAG: OB-fold nucleic acid binding domain-containing protein, partial [Spirochaetales bacterium]